jgi:hypothetical protein
MIMTGYRGQAPVPVTFPGTHELDGFIDDHEIVIPADCATVKLR